MSDKIAIDLSIKRFEKFTDEQLREMVKSLESGPLSPFLKDIEERIDQTKRDFYMMNLHSNEDMLNANATKGMILGMEKLVAYKYEAADELDRREKEKIAKKDE